MEVDTFLAFLVASIVVMAVPGPTVLLVASHAMSWGERPAAFAIAGIDIRRPPTSPSRTDPRTDATLAASAGARPTGASLFLQGFVVNATNPKSLLFYAAFLPPFLDSSAPVAGQLFIMGSTFVLVLLAVCAVYASAAARTGRLLGDGRQARMGHRVAGALLIGTGLAMAVAGERGR